MLFSKTNPATTWQSSGFLASLQQAQVDEGPWRKQTMRVISTWAGNIRELCPKNPEKPSKNHPNIHGYYHGYPMSPVVRSAFRLWHCDFWGHFTRENWGHHKWWCHVHRSARQDGIWRSEPSYSRQETCSGLSVDHGFSSWSKATNWVRMSIHHWFSHSNLHFKPPSLDFPYIKALKYTKII